MINYTKSFIIYDKTVRRMNKRRLKKFYKFYHHNKHLYYVDQQTCTYRKILKTGDYIPYETIPYKKAIKTKVINVKFMVAILENGDMLDKTVIVIWEIKSNDCR